MKTKFILVLIIMVFITGCDIDKIKSNILQESEKAYLSSPDGKVIVYIKYETQEEKMKIIKTYRRSLDTFYNGMIEDRFMEEMKIDIDYKIKEG